MPQDMMLQAHWRVDVEVDGRDLGLFDTMEFPTVGSDVTKWRPGGQRKQIAVGGLPNTEDTTITRGWDRDRDSVLIPWLNQRVGRGRVKITAQPLDRNFDPKGDASIYTGVLESVSPSNYDHDSSEVSTLDLGVVLNDEVG